MVLRLTYLLGDLLSNIVKLLVVEMNYE